ncbi:hemicentin-1-like [Haliotis cracherodii]|uniref:hemicentin-1-like n=1 Tax=Haliotis cracherodii TaxID=6455 RepID=UPI0039E898C1
MAIRENNALQRKDIHSPAISGLPSTYQVTESATLRLDCSSYTTYGYPSATTYSWSHGGSSVGRGAVLTRSSISRSQGGEYTCTVGNTVGSDIASVNVTILYSPDISGLQSTYQVTESATLRLDCSSHTTHGNPSATTYSWSHGGSTVSRGAVLTRSSISRSQGGAYTCTARNTVGSDSASVNVDVRYSPEISGLPSTYQVNESATLRLDCSSYTTHGNPSATTYSWSHGQSSVGRRAVLTRSNISRSQGGVYTCTVRNTVGSDSASVNVTILYSPAISGLPSTYQVTESATLRLDCSSYTTYGYPSATTYSWSHGGSTVGRGAVLTRSSISRSQGGAYTCTARNTVGSDSASVNVDVRYSPDISGLPSTYQVTESATFRLDCSSHTTHGNPSATTYSWSHGGSTVSRGAVLTRSSISRSQGGAYTCTARNTVGSDSASVNVDVRYSPEISGLPSTYQVNESATLRLDCSSYTRQGNPQAATYSWSHGGSSVGRGAVLTRSSISRSQGGAYTCTVRNTVGSDSAPVNVDVQYSPVLSGVPLDYQVMENSSVSINCTRYTSPGNPSTTNYTWSYGTSTVSTKAVLQLNNIKRTARGQYTCNVSNAVGKEAASVTIDVQYSPTLSGFPSTYQVIKSSRLWIDCSNYTTDGNPATTDYSWVFKGSTVSSGAVLKIDAIRGNQGGRYTCTASNTLSPSGGSQQQGAATAQVDVVVQYVPSISGLPSTLWVVEESQLWINCSNYTSRGNPATTNYTWSYRQSVISTEEVLQIDDVNRTEGGQYICTVSNFVGSESASVSVDVQYAPLTSVFPSTYRVSESSNLRIDCSNYTTAGNPPSTSFMWTYGGSTVSTGAVLARRNISPDQGGQYTCIASNTLTPYIGTPRQGIATAQINVDVQYAPSISGLPSTLWVVEESQLWINCSNYISPGNPETTNYTWSYEQSVFSTEEVLQINNINRTEGGRYTCTVSNLVGSESASVSVDVQYVPSISGFPPIFRVIESSRLWIDCGAYTTHGHPEVTRYFWTFNGSQVSASSLLGIDGISRGQAGQYTCTARNTLTPSGGSEQQGEATARVNVDVQFAPSISGLPPTHWVVEESQLWINCSKYTSPGNPATTNYTWIYGQSVFSNEEVLQVDNINRTKAGQYTCTVSNAVGSESASVSVDVKYAPSLSGFPSSYQVVEDSDLWINCRNYTSPGKPSRSNYTWSYEGSVFNAVAVLRDRGINRTAAGLYTCNVNNEVGSDSATVNVIVQYAPSLSDFPSSYGVIETSRVWVDCSSYIVQGHPPTTNYTWTLNSSVISTSSVLEIHNTSRNQGGQYTCTAYNTLTPSEGPQQLGSATGQVVLDIQYPPTISGLPSLMNVTEFSSFSVDCSNVTTPGNPGGTNYTWTHNGYTVSAEPKLVLESMSRNQSGLYTCTASNMLRPSGGRLHLGTASEPVSVDVQYGPRDSVTITPSGSLSMVEGTGVFTATCTAECNPSCAITWRKDNTPLAGQMSLNNVSRTDQGDYTCQAQNGVGESQEKNIRLTVYSPPSVPTDFQVASVTDTSVSLQWTSSFDGGADQTFTLLYKSELESHWLTWNDNIADPGSSHHASVHIQGLTPAVTYHFQLYATNVYGEGEITLLNTTTTLSKASVMSKHGITIGLAAGLGILVVVALVTVSVVLCRRQTQHTSVVGGEEPTNLPMNSFMPRPSPFLHGSVDVNTKSCDVTTQSSHTSDS